MTDQKHTKELWRILQKNSYFEILSGPDNDPINILPSMSNCYLDKASRAIECVNACAGIENPKDFIAQLTAVTKQRDELRNALEKILDAWQCYVDLQMFPENDKPYLDAMSVLTKTKESV